jgi:CHAT domain-containing protein/Flp pilus assembly protein TadD
MISVPIRRSLSGLLLFGTLALAAEESPLTTMRRLVEEGSYAQAETLARRQIDRLEREGRQDSQDAADTTLVLVEALWRGGKEKNPETLALARRSVEICGKAYGEEDPKFAESLTDLAIVMRRIDDLDGARATLRRVLALKEKTYGPRSMEVATTLSNLSAPEGMSGNFTEARVLLERALSISEERNARTTVVSNILYNLGTLNEHLGDYASSRNYYERAFEIRRRDLSLDHPLTAAASFALGMSLMRLGDFPAARAHYEQALSVQEKTLGADHPEFADSLNSLAVLLGRMGRYAEAKPLQERALSILEKALGTDHTRVLEMRYDLASLLTRMGELDEAKRLLEMTAAVQERVEGPSHPDCGRSLNRLAEVESRLREFPDAQRHFERALAIFEKVYGDDHPDTAASLDGLGQLRYMAGDFERAETLIGQALAIRRAKLGPSHPTVAEELTSLAGVHWAQGKARRAFEESLQAEDILRSHFGRSLRGFSERDALDYEKVRSSGLDMLLSVLASAPSAAASKNDVARGWMALIRSRALVLDQMASLHRTASGQEDPEVAGLFRDFAAASNRMAALVVRGPEPAHPDRYASELQNAGSEKESLERRLAERSASFQRSLEEERSTFEEVRSSLPRNTALVAYALYHRNQQGPARPTRSSDAVRREDPAYMAFVLGAAKDRPVSIPIGEAGEIDRLVDEWRQASVAAPAALPAARERREHLLREAGARLRSRIWDPVAGALGTPGQVFVVPDGALNLISFATLPAGEDRYLIESGPMFHYLSTERDLLAPVEAVRSEGTGILILGGADFDARPGTAGASPSKESSRPANLPKTDAAAAVARIYRSPSASCDDFRALRFDPLPASIEELAEIRAVFEEREAAAGPAAAGVVALTEGGASEEAFKSLAPGHRILHLATHGFFLNDRCASSQVTDGPLLLSGLALAAANRRNEAGPGDEDGILTSEEIAALDLSGVEWVVLSSCESGLGRIQSGEGVLGLRRAFQVAGARTLISSLWKVEDEATREWMRHLYEGRLRGLSTAQAVRQAGLAILDSRRAKGLSTEPFFWGAFTAAGDWR